MGLHPDIQRFLGTGPEIPGRSLLVGGRDVSMRPIAMRAVCFNEPSTHRSIQLKGPVLSVALAEASRRPVLERYVDHFAHELDGVGLSHRLIRRLNHWPALELVFSPEAIFQQTPGPGAGVSIDSSKETHP